MALTLLGLDPVVSIDDDSNRARVMKIHYGPARDKTLESHEWTFAMKRFQPAELSEAPLFGWDLQFAIPADIIRVTDVEREPTSIPFYAYRDAGSNRHFTPHVIEGRTILANYTIFCRGIMRIDNEGLFTPNFVECLSAQLAYRTAMALTESNSKRDAMLQEWKMAIKEAKAADGMQGSTRRLRMRGIISSR
jgi:hypothetical protein